MPSRKFQNENESKCWLHYPVFIICTLQKMDGPSEAVNVVRWHFVFVSNVLGTEIAR